MKRLFDGIDVLIYSDLNIVLIGLKYLLQELGCKTVITCNDFDQVASLLSDKSKKFDMLLVDFNCGIGEALQKITTLRRVSHGKQLKIVAFVDRREQMPFYFTVGVNRVVTKQTDEQELGKVINAILQEKEHAESAPIYPNPQTAFIWDEFFSERESQVLNLLALGFSQREIGRKLNVSNTTVSTYKKRALGKVGMKSIGELLFWGWK